MEVRLGRVEGRIVARGSGPISMKSALILVAREGDLRSRVGVSHECVEKKCHKHSQI